MNPRDNQTRRDDLRGYTLACDLIDHLGRRSTFWFRRPEDREAFAGLFNDLHTNYGHTTKVEVKP